MDLEFGKKKSFPWAPDNDQRKRNCEIKLMVRDIDGSIAEHWALYFVWTDTAATYEANDENGFLIPTWNRGKPDPSYSWKVSDSLEERCSPRDVNFHAQNVTLNGQCYLLTERNCHHWAIALASKFGFEISGALETFLPDDWKSLIDFGYCIGNLFSRAGPSTAGSTGFSNTGYSRAMVPTGSRVASSSLRASAVIAECRADLSSDADSSRERSNPRNSSMKLASTSRVAARSFDDDKNKEEDSSLQTAAVIGGVMFAGFAFGALLKSLTDDIEKTSKSSHGKNRSFFE